MSETTDGSPTPEEAQALLAQVAQLESITKTGSSWPQIAGLLTLGATSSLALPAIAFASDGLLALPMIFMTLWIAASFVFMTVFSTSVKRGFGRRWFVTVGIWAVIWVIGILGVSTWFVDQAWFLAGACAALTAITMIGAWIEARR